MKAKMFLLLMAAATLFMVYSCEDDLLDITETFEYEAEMVILTDQTTYTITQDIDLADSVDLINEYSDKIKNIEIEEVTYWITAFNGTEEQVLTEATLIVANLSGDDPKVIAAIEDKMLMDLVDTPTDLEVNQEGVDRLAALIETPPHSFKLTFTSEANEGPMDFTAHFKFKFKMTANPLN
jgi:hypothetical protein